MYLPGGMHMLKKLIISLTVIIIFLILLQQHLPQHQPPYAHLHPS